MRTSVHSFLEKFVEVCQINTDVPKVIKIALIVEPDAFDYEVLETEDKPVESATSGENWDDEIEDIEIPVDNPYILETEDKPVESATSGENWDDEIEDIEIPVDNLYKRAASTESAPKYRSSPENEIQKENMKSNLEIQTERKVTDFTIGKTFVKQKPGAYFNPMKPTTWSLGGGINGRWQDYKNEDYDGLIVLACIERDLIPQHTKECNKRAILMDKKTIKANQQNYALALEQALIHYYVLIKPDERLRNQSFDIGNLSKEPYKGGIVYVAYKLEPEPSYSDDEFEAISNQVNQSAIDLLEAKLSDEGLYFRGEISNDGNSFFRSCSDQLERLEMPSMDHAELRQKIAQQLRGMPTGQIYDAHFTNEEWNIFIKKIERPAKKVHFADDVSLAKQPKLEKEVDRGENWDKLVEMVYNKRDERLSREIVHHYEENLDLKTTLKSRIKDYVTRGKKTKENEKDPDVKALIQLI
ncbi:unnamed protein product [Mytilus edulis]|uniref:Uncharacterized protein n=1 Tax=Mytilus edulis TaxID=6550 RepID=A0A8S3UZP1_MYTED|nr:unnamed protein product [Mytilus edulis]